VSGGDASDRDPGGDQAAVASARAALGIDEHEPVATWSVARTPPGTSRFLLAVFGEPGHAIGIAAVDPTSGDVLESARLPGTQPHTLITADEAIRRAGFGPGTQSRLVWDPSPATRSRFYPLWELRDGERQAWVDSVSGKVWPTLSSGRAGG
jgi:hypothetical protein